jgi:PP-loop superfamily ATP-utilizing enzyme
MARREEVRNEELRKLVDEAYRYMREGNGTEAVRTLSRTYLRLLEMKPELLEKTVEMRAGRHMPLVMRWPALGANLTLESVRAGKPQIEFVRDRFAVSEAMTYYEYVVEAIVHDQ